MAQFTAQLVGQGRHGAPDETGRRFAVDVMSSLGTAERKTFLISAITIAIGVWDTAFFLGVHGTIFFEKLFALWVAGIFRSVAIKFPAGAPGIDGCIGR